MKRLMVTHYKVMRRMVGLSPWCGASAMFVRSFQEVMRILTSGLLERVENSEKMIFVSLNGIIIIIVSLNGSDASVWSWIRAS